MFNISLQTSSGSRTPLDVYNSGPMKNSDLLLPFEDGYPDVLFKGNTELVENNRCAICLNVYRDPVSDSCSPPHTYCLSCVSRVTSQKCPLNPSNMIGTLTINLAIKKKLDKIKVICLNNELGCQFDDQLSKLNSHLKKECQHRLVECPHPKCGKVMPAKTLASHLEDCEFRVVECPNMFCMAKMEKFLIAEHLFNQCEYRKTKCPTCNQRVTGKELIAHMESECPKAMIPCPFHNIIKALMKAPKVYMTSGSLEKMLNCCAKVERSKLPQHFQENLEDHTHIMLVLAGQSSRVLTKMNSSKMDSEAAKEEISTMITRVSSLEATYNEAQETYEAQQGKVRELEEKLISLENYERDAQNNCSCNIF